MYNNVKEWLTMLKLFIDRVLKRVMYNSKIKQKSTRELKEALNELDYMENHLEEYKVYNDVDKMFEDILKNWI